jgi:hypothetical protein
MINRMKQTWNRATILFLIIFIVQIIIEYGKMRKLVYSSISTRDYASNMTDKKVYSSHTTISKAYLKVILYYRTYKDPLFHG